jgi:hypothetical protein
MDIFSYIFHSFSFFPPGKDRYFQRRLS